MPHPRLPERAVPERPVVELPDLLKLLDCVLPPDPAYSDCLRRNPVHGVQKDGLGLDGTVRVRRTGSAIDSLPTPDSDLYERRREEQHRARNVEPQRCVVERGQGHKVKPWQPDKEHRTRGHVGVAAAETPGQQAAAHKNRGLAD